MCVCFVYNSSVFVYLLLLNVHLQVYAGKVILSLLIFCNCFVCIYFSLVVCVCFFVFLQFKHAILFSKLLIVVFCLLNLFVGISGSLLSEDLGFV